MNFIFIPLGAVLFVLFFAPVFFGVINFANIIGMLFSAALVFYGIFFKSTNLMLKDLWQTTFGKTILSVFSVLAASAVIYILTATVLMACAANKTPPRETSVVVLGCKINPDGPSLTLLSRLEAAHSFLTENPKAVCVLSGGQGEDEHISEAQAMYDWLSERGIDNNRLYTEDKSTSTYENLLFSKRVIEENSLPANITVITNEFHQYRAGLIAKKLGFSTYSISAKTPFYLFPTYYVRELFGIIYNLAETNK